MSAALTAGSSSSTNESLWEEIWLENTPGKLSVYCHLIAHFGSYFNSVRQKNGLPMIIVNIETKAITDLITT